MRRLLPLALCAALAGAPAAASACDTCAAPSWPLGDPTTSCQSLANIMSCGWVSHSVVLVQGQTYTFTVCDPTCLGSGAAFNSGLELYDPSGALVASSTNACGDDGEIVYTTDAATGGGTYCIRLVDEGGGNGVLYILAWRIACQAPSDPDLSPLVGSASGAGCSKNQAFIVVPAGTPMFDLAWSITPPPGCTAAPMAGGASSPDSDIPFSSLLTGLGNYSVSITVSNECGSVTEIFTYTLEDRAAPNLRVTSAAASCGIRGHAEDGSTPEPPLAKSAGLPSRLGALDDGAGRVPEDPADEEQREAKRARLPVLEAIDGSLPDLRTPPHAEAVSCGSPCTSGTLNADQPFYDVFLDCSNFAFTALTGMSHSVTTSSGFQQNVIFSGGNPGTSDVAWYFHDLGRMYQNPTGASACVFDPPDTPAEQDSIGLEQELIVAPSPDLTVTLREELVAFGMTEADSGIRMTLSITSSPTSTRTTQVGMRWQVDYQNAGDDGPLFATVACDPPAIVSTVDLEHELAPTEIMDFYRIQNNTGAPIFSNYTNTTAMYGFPDTGTPDRLVFGAWPRLVGSAWDYVTTEGGGGTDSDSAVLYYFGHDLANAITLAPGETVTRSVVIFTSGDSVDCGGFVPGTSSSSVVTVCEGECARITATGTDACGAPAVSLVSTSPGAPICAGNPCVVRFPTAGNYTYTWEAEDSAGNTTRADAVVEVLPSAECSGCSPTGVVPPAPDRICVGGSTTLDGRGLSLSGCTGSVIYEWRDGTGVVGTGPTIVVSPTVTTTYTCTVWCDAALSCRTSADVTITVDRPPDFAAPVAQEHGPCNVAIDVTWSPALFHGPGGTGVYNVYRSGISCADALSRLPVAMGLTGTQWVDDGAIYGVPAYYVVEAEDDSTGSPCAPHGPFQGGSATRQCVGPVVDLTSDVGPIPAGVYTTLFVRHVGQWIEARWPTARALLPNEHFHVRKVHLDAQLPFELISPEGSTARTFAETDTTSWLQFFHVHVANPCETESLREYPPGRDPQFP